MTKELFPTATVEALLITEKENDFFSTPQDKVLFNHLGLKDDVRHSGRAKRAGPRLPWLAKNREVKNRDQVSLIDLPSLYGIFRSMELDASHIAELGYDDPLLFLARSMGANVVVNSFKGTPAIPTFYHLPNSTDYGPYDEVNGRMDQAVVTIARYNVPCTFPGKRLAEAYFNEPSKSEKAQMGLAFLRAAERWGRGFVGPVIGCGAMAVGQQVAFRSLPQAPSHLRSLIK